MAMKPKAGDMGRSDRRTFLKQAAGLIPVAAVGARDVVAAEGEGVTPDRTHGGPDGKARGRTSSRLANEAVLEAVAEATLPVEALGAAGVARVVDGFQGWLDAYEPVAELNHPYLTHELRYAPADPGPRWQAQLDALDTEAPKRHGKPFPELSVAERRTLLEPELREDRLASLPNTTRARHVAMGLLAYFYSTPEATDLCYEADISRFDCRGLQDLAAPPRPLRREE